MNIERWKSEEYQNHIKIKQDQMVIIIDELISNNWGEKQLNPRREKRSYYETLQIIPPPPKKNIYQKEENDTEEKEEGEEGRRKRIETKERETVSNGSGIWVQLRSKLITTMDTMSPTGFPAAMQLQSHMFSHHKQANRNSKKKKNDNKQNKGKWK